jgi:hypothetical protein
MTQEDEYLAHLAALREQNWPAGVPREIHYPLGRRPVSEYLRERARLQPDKAVVIFYGRALGFAELDASLRCCPRAACSAATAWRCSCPTARSSSSRSTAS